jgi:secreted Zn-dependent insulinase-like peptidase
MLPQKKFPKLRRFFLEMLSLFGSTYVCEAVFSTMNIIKSRVRNRLDNPSLESCLRLSLTGLPIDIDKPSVQKQAQ